MEDDLLIESRAEFHRILEDTIALVERLRGELPGFPPFENIARQLAAIKEWTANGRVPNPPERESIDVGLVAARELETNTDPRIRELRQNLYALDEYFTEFPTSRVR
jgi:hypothetical protein